MERKNKKFLVHQCCFFFFFSIFQFLSYIKYKLILTLSINVHFYCMQISKPIRNWKERNPPKKSYPGIQHSL